MTSLHVLIENTEIRLQFHVAQSVQSHDDFGSLDTHLPAKYLIRVEHPESFHNINLSMLILLFLSIYCPCDTRPFNISLTN